jgi:pyruvate,water dikinase
VGLGEAVVGGLVTPDSLILEKATGAILARDIADKAVMTVRTADVERGDGRAGAVGRRARRVARDRARLRPHHDQRLRLLGWRYRAAQMPFVLVLVARVLPLLRRARERWQDQAGPAYAAVARRWEAEDLARAPAGRWTERRRA